METIANWYEKKDRLFVETRACTELRNILDDMHWATLLGKPGDGKSSTAGHIMLEYRRKGYTPVFAESVQDWKSLVRGGKSTAGNEIKQIVVIDDMFGASCVDQNKVGEWLSWIENMVKIVEERNGNLIVVCTCRRYIFSDIQSSLERYKCFRKMSLTDMTDAMFQLSDKEKEKIFNVFAEKYNVTGLDGAEVSHIDPPHGFPLCAEMFCTNTFLQQNGIAFFQNPVECVQKEIVNFKENDYPKYIVLLMVLLKKNHMPRDYFNNLYDVATDDEKRFFKLSGFPLDSASPTLVKARNSLINTYIKTGPEGFDSFTHKTMIENVSEVYLTASTSHAIEMIDFTYIADFVNAKSNSKTGLSADIYEPICKRVTKEIKLGNVLDICRCDIWDDETFIDNWILHLQSEPEINEPDEILKCGDSVGTKWSVQYEIIARLGIIDYCPLSTHEFKRAALYSVISALVYCRRKCAVCAILMHNVISLDEKQGSYWRDALQLGLEIACTQPDNIEVLQALVSQKTNRNLNGSKALAISLAFSYSEYAEILLKDSLISPDFTDESGRGYFHYLIDSNIPVDKFEYICELLMGMKSVINGTDATGEPLLFSLTEQLMKQSEGIQKLKILVKAGANIHVKDTAERNIALYSLEKLDAQECLKLLPILKEENVDFQCVDQHGASAIHYFCNKKAEPGSYKLFSYLKETLEVNESQTDNVLRVPFMLALSNVHSKDCISELLKLSPRQHTDKFDRGYFHYVCSSNISSEYFYAFCNLLLAREENINLRDSEGISPLFECIRNEYLSLRNIQYLVEVGAEINATDDAGRNIVLYTIFRRRKHEDLIKFLQYYNQKGVNFHALDNTGRNALHYFHDSDDSCLDCDSISDNAVCDFLTRVVNINCFQTDSDKVTPFMLALEHNPNLTFVKHMIDTGILDMVDKRGRNYFHFLVTSNADEDTFREICSGLLGSGIDINGKDILGRTPLFECFVSQNAFRMECLVKYGARAESNEKWTEQVVAKENAIRLKDILHEAGLTFDTDTMNSDSYTVYLNILSSDEENYSTCSEFDSDSDSIGLSTLFC